MKLNPTFLGAVELRGLLNDTLGYATEVPDEAFAHDIDFATAVDMVRSLQTAADKAGVDFGVKLTNTLECRNIRNVFPADEGMMYMSGRALHPVSVAVASKLQGAVGAGLDMSFAGGADAWNVANLLACGLGPVTVCSDLLRPGGYQRLRQYLEEAEQAVKSAGAQDVDGLAETMTLDSYAEKVRRDPRYHAEAFEDRSIKTERPLPAFDCIAAPCVTTCPAGQDIPGYMRHTADGDDSAALATVLRDNPLPSVTGMVCENPCLERCTRVHYEGAVRIRDVKRYLAGTAEALPPPPKARSLGRKVAVVGAGPAGLACAMALVASGVEVTIYEAKDRPGGMVSGAIPAFRLEDADLQRDLDRVIAAGVDLRCGATVDRDRLTSLRRDHDAVFLGLGAQRDRALSIPGEDLPGVVPALKFLAAAGRSDLDQWTGQVAVIGGGNSAMDAARTAVRLGAEVKVVYRRTQAEMPADAEERRAILVEGVEVLELLAPLSIAPQDGRLALTCQRMRLGEPDESGRRRPEPVDGKTEVLLVDHVIPAVGQRLVWDDSDGSALKTDAEGRLVGEDGCYTGGDARRGPASIVTAMADGRRAARAMLEDFGEDQGQPATAWPAPSRTKAERQDRASRLVAPRLPEVRYSDKAGDFDLVIAGLDEIDARAEADRCLSCDQVCDLCVSVCPNRANISYEVPGVIWPLVRIGRQGDGFTTTPAGRFTAIQGRQTANIADFCNACGNCTTFCPTEGSPFRDKPRLAVSEDAFVLEDDAYRLVDGVVHHRHGGQQETLTRQGETLIYGTEAAQVTLDAATFAVRDVVFAGGAADPVITLESAAAMALLLAGLTGGPLDSSC